MTATSTCACHASARVWYDDDCECVHDCQCGGVPAGAEFAGQIEISAEDIIERVLNLESKVEQNEKTRELVKRCLKAGLINRPGQTPKPKERPRIIFTPHQVESWEASVPGYWGRMVWDRTANPITESDVCGLAIQSAPAETIGPVFLWVADKWTTCHASTP